MNRIKSLVVVTIIASVVLLSSLSFADIKNVDAFYNKIKLVVNGKALSMDTEPCIINGRTMIPARYLAEALDANVVWNETANQVEITSNTPKISTALTNNNSDKEKLKLYALIMNYYKGFSDYSNQISDYADVMYFYTREIINYQDSGLTALREYDAKMVENYDFLVNYSKTINEVTKSAANQNIDITDMNIIMNSLKNAQSKLLSANENLIDFRNNNYSQTYFDYYMGNKQASHTYLQDIRARIDGGYYKYYNLIKNY